MLTPPLISVILPVFNGEKYLREAIDSILNQTIKDFEFLIINDGSTDTTEEIILSYNDPRIVYIKNEQNLKIIKSLNNGIDLANGQFIARMDADDVAYPHRLQTQLNFLICNPDYGVCGSFGQTINELDMVGETLLMPITDKQIKTYLNFSNPIIHPSVLARTEIFKENLYSIDYKTAEDYELWYRLSSITKFYNIPKVLMKYRIHSESISKTDSAQAVQSVIKLKRKIIANKLTNKSLIDMYILFTFKNQNVPIEEYDSWLNEFIKEPLFKNKIFKTYFIKRWFSLCLLSNKRRYILINKMTRIIPFFYFKLLIKTIFLAFYNSKLSKVSFLNFYK